MIEVKYAVSWGDRRRFYGFSHRLYKADKRWEEPSVWRGGRVLEPAGNEMMRLPHALLMAVENGEILARMLVGHSGREGFFSMFDARPQQKAVAVMLAEAEAWLRQSGASVMSGPVSPIPADLGGGVLVEGFLSRPALFDAYNAPYYAELLEACGLRPQSEWLSYRVNLNGFDRNRYGAAADYTQRRYGLTVRSGCARQPRMLADIMRRMLGKEQDGERINRLIGWLLPDLAEDMCPVVTAGDTPVGWLLTMGGRRGRVRIATLWVDEAWRRKGVTAILFREAAEAAARRGLDCVDASAIRNDNLASRLGVERAGGSILQRHIQYSKKI